MGKRMVCWRCGESLHEIPRPFPRLEKCHACGADLHVCYMCHYYNPQMSDHCDHELAEAAREPDLANFCHYLKLKPNADTKRFNKAKQAESELRALFGDEGNTSAESVPTELKKEDQLDPLKALFKEETADKSGES